MTVEFKSIERTGPLVVSMPHVGHALPKAVREQLSRRSDGLSDADWHVDRLYDFLEAENASELMATWSRWVIDLNRPPEGTSLYPGQATTGLCPGETFLGLPLYETGHEPGNDEVELRLRSYWRPYHDRLKALIAAAKARHGTAVVVDAHSIVSTCPRLFDGRLPDINIGTHDGGSCDPPLQRVVEDVLRAQTRFDWVINGRFKGGYITRHYGRPTNGVHAVQIELAQSAYMDEAYPSRWDDARAAPLRGVLRDVIAAINAWSAAAPAVDCPAPSGIHGGGSS